MRPFSYSLAPLPKLAFGAAVALAALSLSAGAAQAACESGSVANTLCRVTVGGLQYDVTTFTGTQSAPSDISTSGKFATAANGGVMPWWGNGTLANEFASAVRSWFSTPNLFDQANTFSAGPLFAYDGSTEASFYAYTLSSTNPGVNDTIFSSMTNYIYSNPMTYAQATLYTNSAPGPLPLFGAGAAFGFSRKLRKRIQASRLPVGSGQPRA